MKAITLVNAESGQRKKPGAPHSHSPSHWHADPEHALDIALQDSFPASDPVATSVCRPILIKPHIAVEATALSLSHKWPVERVLQAIVQNCLQHIRANEAAVAQGQGKESLHQMRVGLRRLVSTFKLFEAWHHPPQDLRTALEDLLSRLGAGRDWEVLHQSTLTSLAETTSSITGLNALLQAVQAKSLTLNSTVAADVAAPHYRQLLDQISDWNQTLCTAKHDTSIAANIAANIAELADQILRQRQKVLLKRARLLPEHTPKERHRLRIAAKKVRYATEFLQSLYKKDQIKPFLRALKALQDKLGTLNDLAVADQLLAQLQLESPALKTVVDEVRPALAQQMQDQVCQLSDLWRQFGTVPLPQHTTSQHRHKHQLRS